MFSAISSSPHTLGSIRQNYFYRKLHLVTHYKADITETKVQSCRDVAEVIMQHSTNTLGGKIMSTAC